MRPFGKLKVKSLLHFRKNRQMFKKRCYTAKVTDDYNRAREVLIKSNHGIFRKHTTYFNKIKSRVFLDYSFL